MVEFNDIKVKVLEENGTESTIEISPLPRGYGNTLANSLRRILLSSLKGAAITSVKIKGIEHEYTAIDNIKEDVLEILLNLKALKFSMTSDDMVTATIDVSGDGVVTAADLKLPGGVEVTNKDAHIATLTDKDAKLNIEVTIEKGVGYKEAVEEDRSEVGRIPLDADFTPINKVSLNVKPARRGQATDLDAVEIIIDTDGSIDALDALLDAAKTLQEFAGKVMGALGMPINVIEELAESTQELPEEEVEVESEETNEVDGWKVEDMPISKRSKSGLLAGEYLTVGDLREATKEDLLTLPGFGNKSLNEVVEQLKEYGVELKSEK